MHLLDFLREYGGWWVTYKSMDNSQTTASSAQSPTPSWMVTSWTLCHGVSLSILPFLLYSGISHDPLQLEEGDSGDSLLTLPFRTV